MKRDWIQETIAALLIILFVYAAMSKLFDYSNFLLQLGQSPFISKYAKVLSIVVPISEIMISVALVFPITRSLGFYGSYFIMLSFSLYITAMLKLSYYVPCSCGGILSRLGWTEHLILNLAFLFLAALGVFLYQPKINA